MSMPFEAGGIRRNRGSFVDERSFSFSNIRRIVPGSARNRAERSFAPCGNRVYPACSLRPGRSTPAGTDRPPSEMPRCSRMTRDSGFATPDVRFPECRDSCRTGAPFRSIRERQWEFRPPFPNRNLPPSIVGKDLRRDSTCIIFAADKPYCDGASRQNGWRRPDPCYRSGAESHRPRCPDSDRRTIGVAVPGRSGSGRPTPCCG